MVEAYGPEALNGMEAHHGIPLQLINDPQVGPIIRMAAEDGFDINGVENGIIAPENHGPHPEYTADIKQWIIKASGEVKSTADAKTLLDLIVNDARLSVDYWFD